MRHFQTAINWLNEEVKTSALCLICNSTKRNCWGQWIFYRFGNVLKHFENILPLPKWFSVRWSIFSFTLFVTWALILDLQASPDTKITTIQVSSNLKANDKADPIYIYIILYILYILYIIYIIYILYIILYIKNGWIMLNIQYSSHDISRTCSIFMSS